MIVNPDHHGRTTGGRYTFRPLIEYEPDDFPPDSQYWEKRARYHMSDLGNILGNAAYASFAESTWPGAAIEEYSWKEISIQVEAAHKAALVGERDLCKLTVIAWEAFSQSKHSTKTGEAR